MRKMILFCLGVFITHVGSAQVILKGDRLIGGSLGAYAHNTSPNTVDNRSSNAGIYPSLSFGIANNLVFGVRGSMGYARNSNSQSTGENIHSSFATGLGLFLKKYRPFENRFGLYMDHSITGSFFSNKYVNPLAETSRQKAWGIGYQLSPGVFYRFTERFFGEANIGGLYASYSTGINSSTRNFNFGASLLQYFNVGINYRFARKGVSTDISTQ